jgi:hypothetical protein
MRKGDDSRKEGLGGFHKNDFATTLRTHGKNPSLAIREVYDVGQARA